MVAFVPTFQATNPILDLGQYRLSPHPAAGTKAAVIAERTSAFGDCPVDVRTGEPSIDADFLNPMPKSTLQIIAIGVVAMASLAPSWRIKVGRLGRFR